VDIPETRYAPTPDGGFIAYKAIGEGPVDVAYVGPQASQIEVQFEYEPMARFLLDLASSTRLIMHDRRGTGLSDAGRGLPNLETRAADLRAVLDTVGSSRPFLFGYGDGGEVCALQAATHPDRVAGFLWFAPAARSVQAPDWPYGYLPEALEKWIDGIPAGWGNLDFIRREYFEAFDVPFDEPFAKWLAKMQRVFCGPETAQQYYRLAYEEDVRAVLPALRVPTLVMDVVLPDESWAGIGEATAALIPGVEYRRLPGPLFLWSEAEYRLAIIRRFLGVERPHPVFDRVLATVMFTDIVDSTAAAARLGDSAWHRVLDAHDQIAIESVARYRGRLIRSTGDGVLATFDGPARAVFAAREISERMRSLDLQVRAGAHAGEIELGDQGVHGIAVHVAARVAAMAGNSEILVSSTVKDLVVGSGLAFEDAGEHELKGVPDPWHLYRLVE
jgi:class 3 adenylate cyclase/pimeloyl-ACP methyl ester carboxylesterase